MKKRQGILFSVFVVMVVGLFAGLLYMRPYINELLVKWSLSHLSAAPAEVLKDFKSLEPKSRQRVLHAVLYGRGEVTPAALAVLSGAEELDLSVCSNQRIIQFARAGKKFYRDGLFSEEFAHKVGKELFRQRPSGPDSEYYELLFGFNSFDLDNNVSDYSIRALRFLACCQAPGGTFWSEDGTREGDLLTTARVFFAFLSKGCTHNIGPYRSVMTKALDRLMKYEDGNFSDDTYTQAMCTMALNEFYAMTLEKSVKKLCELSIDELASRVNPDGGFPAMRGGNESDVHATTYATLAFKAARTGNIRSAMKKKMENEYSRFLKSRASSADNNDAAGIVISLIFCGQRKKAEPIPKLVKILDANKPSWEKMRDIDYVYLGTYSLFQVGGSVWSRWFKAKNRMFWDSCLEKPFNRASWNPVMGDRSKKYGRLYTTAMAVSTQALYYTHRILRPPRIKKP